MPFKFLRIICLCSLFVACCTSGAELANAATGSIHGTVKGSGNFIAGATVRLLEPDRGTRTNDKGEFVFSNVPRGSYNVFVRALGYASMTNNVDVNDNNAESNFTLTESPIPGKEVIVTASPYAQTNDNLYQPAESKSMADLHESPGSSFAEKISDLPGVTVRSNGSAPSRPMLRGLSDNNVLVLENGLRMGDIATYDPAHATPMETEGITQIDVVRGPAAILYGPNAMDGLVNVITNNIPVASSNPFSGTLSLGGNTVSDEYTGFFNGVYSNGGHAFSISAGGLHSQDINIPSGTYVDPGSGAPFDLSRLPQTFDHSSERGAGYSYQGEFGMIGLGYKHYEMNYGIPGVPPNDNWLNVPPGTSRIEQEKDVFELRGLFAVDGSLIKQIKLNANYNDYGHSEYPTAQDSTGISDPQANHFHKQTFNANLQFQHQQIGKFQGTVGMWIDIENLDISGDQPLGPNSRTTGIAGYIFEEYVPNEDTRFQLGLRYDINHIQTSPFAASTDSVFQTLDTARSSNAFTASIGMITKLTPEMTLSVNVGRSFRAATVQELFANGADDASGTYSIGSSSLNPETGLGIDASLKGNFTTMTFEFSPYVNIISNYIYAFLRGDTITAPPSGPLPVRQFAATDARLMGFEASATMKLTSMLALRASVDYVNAEDTKQNVPLPFTPPMRGLLRLNYINDMYSGMLEWRLAAAQTQLGDGDTYTAGYGIVNLGVGVHFVQASTVHRFSLHVDNLLNQVYRDNLSVIKDFLPQPARGIRLNYDLAY